MQLPSLASPRTLALVAAGALAAAGAWVFIVQRPPPRINVLVPDGAAEFALMDFSKPFDLDAPPPGWRHRRFWTRSPMALSFAEKGGVRAMRMETQASASMFFRQVDVRLADYPLLRWRWLIEKPIASTLDERTREGDDHPARFYLALRTEAGEERRFEIIWGNKLKRGETKYIGTFPHYVADGGDENAGAWRDEEVDLVAVTRMFWQDGRTSRLLDLALFCDSDETKTSSIAYVADVRVAKR